MGVVVVLHICFVVWKFPSFTAADHAGGAEKQLSLLAEKLKLTEHSITIISGRKGRNPRTERLSDNVIVHRIPTASLPALSMLIFMTVIPIALLRLHFRRRIDVIHIPLPDLFILPIHLLATFVRIPVIARIAADELDQSHSRGLWAVVRNLIRAIILKADGIQTLNPRAYRDALRLGKPEEDVFLVPNGVDIPNRQRDYQVLYNRILYVGAMRYYPNKLHVEQKNLVYLIDAFQEVVRVLPELTLVMVGNGNYKITLQEYVESRGLEDKVVFAGYQTDVLPYLFEADLLMNPSHFEGMPNTVIEAMAAGVFVICSDIPEHRYLMEDDKYGQLVDKSDHRSLAREIVRFYEGPEPFVERAQNGRKRVMATLSRSQLTRRTLSMYSAVLRRKSNTRTNSSQDFTAAP